MNNSAVAPINIQKINAAGITEAADLLAVEEPLEIQLAYSTETGRMQKNISVTMRTPGNDEELAAGFLFTEGIIQQKEAIKEISHIGADENRVLVTLIENHKPLLNNMQRNFYTSSSCGICGKASIDAVKTVSAYTGIEDDIQVSAALFHGLQTELTNQQLVFESTGGLHASALFDLQGNLKLLREDIGRHNALDKIAGAALLSGSLPLSNHILLLSGRASFELIQKAVMAGIKIIAAVGAPSSLAVELAAEYGLTLIGFLRNGRFNIYTGPQRVTL